MPEIKVLKGTYIQADEPVLDEMERAAILVLAI